MNNSLKEYMSETAFYDKQEWNIFHNVSSKLENAL